MSSVAQKSTRLSESGLSSATMRRPQSVTMEVDRHDISHAPIRNRSNTCCYDQEQDPQGISVHHKRSSTLPLTFGFDLSSTDFNWSDDVLFDGGYRTPPFERSQFSRSPTCDAEEQKKALALESSCGNIRSSQVLSGPPDSGLSSDARQAETRHRRHNQALSSKQFQGILDDLSGDYPTSLSQ